MAETLESAPTLAQQTEQCVDAFMSQLPDEAKKTVAQAFGKLAASDTGAHAIAPGEKAPDFSLPNVNGEPVQLSELVKNGPLVLSFYRGGWCPFCNLEFKALIDILPEIQALGAQLVGISPETPDVSAQTVEKHHIPFEVLSDQGNAVCRDYGLLFQVYEELQPLYLEWGLDIPAFNGDESWELPVPATYIIGTDRRVHAAFVDKDYTKRMEPFDIIKALKSM